MAGPDAWGRGRGWLGRVAGGADVGSEFVPVGFRQIRLHLLVPRFLQVVGGGVLQVGLDLWGQIPSGTAWVGTRRGTGGHRGHHGTLSTSPGTGGGDWKWTGVLMAGLEATGMRCCCM